MSDFRLSYTVLVAIAADVAVARYDTPVARHVYVLRAGRGVGLFEFCDRVPDVRARLAAIIIGVKFFLFRGALPADGHDRRSSAAFPEALAGDKLLEKPYISGGKISLARLAPFLVVVVIPAERNDDQVRGYRVFFGQRSGYRILIPGFSARLQRPTVEGRHGELADLPGLAGHRVLRHPRAREGLDADVRAEPAPELGAVGAVAVRELPAEDLVLEVRLAGLPVDAVPMLALTSLFRADALRFLRIEKT